MYDSKNNPRLPIDDAMDARNGDLDEQETPVWVDVVTEVVTGAAVAAVFILAAFYCAPILAAWTL